jgi:hypothetical protein
LLLVLPWIKPKEDKGDGRFPYYAYPATALAILGSGVVYWVGWVKVRSGVFDGGGVGEERIWARGHKSVQSDESVPMMGFVEEDGGESESENAGMRKRAPCGCLLDHGTPRGGEETRLDGD